MKQKQALKALKNGKNIFLTGPAGSGKTFVLQKYIKWLKKERIKSAITASTGVAATHINGRTIHSWSGIGIKENFAQKDIKEISGKYHIQKHIEKTKVLIIDEISMLNAKQFEAVDRICRYVKKNSRPFGGIQVVLSGDFFQLPPVSRTVKKSFVYTSPLWKEADIQVCYLEEQHRQKDKELTKILNEIRANRVSEQSKKILNDRKDAPVKGDITPTKLYTHNANVDYINTQEIEKLETREEIYEMAKEGEDFLVEILTKSCTSPKTLKLKIGAQVMFTKNNFEVGYVNGTIGIIIDFDEYGYPVVETLQKDIITVSESDWSVEEDGKELAKIYQLPLRLAWAITVHKSQGMSLDSAEIDLSKSFEPGMGYVALSRIRNLKNLRLLGINQKALEVNQEIIKQDKEFKKQSKKA